MLITCIDALAPHLSVTDIRNLKHGNKALFKHVTTQHEAAAWAALVAHGRHQWHELLQKNYGSIIACMKCIMHLQLRLECRNIIQRSFTDWARWRSRTVMVLRVAQAAEGGDEE